jgi:hypothetical protein
MPILQENNFCHFELRFTAGSFVYEFYFSDSDDDSTYWDYSNPKVTLNKMTVE